MIVKKDSVIVCNFPEEIFAVPADLLGKTILNNGKKMGKIIDWLHSNNGSRSVYVLLGEDFKFSPIDTYLTVGS